VPDINLNKPVGTAEWLIVYRQRAIRSRQRAIVSRQQALVDRLLTKNMIYSYLNHKGDTNENYNRMWKSEI